MLWGWLQSFRWKVLRVLAMVHVSEQQLDQPWEDNEFPYSPHKHRSVKFPKSCWVRCLHQYFLVKGVWWRVGMVTELQKGSRVVCLCVWTGSVKNVTLETCCSVYLKRLLDWESFNAMQYVFWIKAGGGGGNSVCFPLGSGKYYSHGT